MRPMSTSSLHAWERRACHAILRLSKRTCGNVPNASQQQTGAGTPRSKPARSGVGASVLSRASSAVTGLLLPTAGRNSPILRPYRKRASVEQVVAARHAWLPEWDAALLPVREEPTAGSPMHAAIPWTHLTHQEIADRLAAEQGIEGRGTVRSMDTKNSVERSCLPSGHAVHPGDYRAVCS